MHFVIIILIVLFSCNISTNQLENNVQTIELDYIPWACDCANWAYAKDAARYHDKGDTLATLSIFIEPANSSLKLPDTIGYINDRVRFTGQFYQRKGFPKGYKSEQPVEKSRVFRYSSYQVIKSNFGKAHIDSQALNAEKKNSL